MRTRQTTQVVGRTLWTTNSCTRCSSPAGDRDFGLVKRVQRRRPSGRGVREDLGRDASGRTGAARWVSEARVPRVGISRETGEVERSCPASSMTDQVELVRTKGLPGWTFRSVGRRFLRKVDQALAWTASPTGVAAASSGGRKGLRSLRSGLLSGGKHRGHDSWSWLPTSLEVEGVRHVCWASTNGVCEHIEQKALRSGGRSRSSTGAGNSGHTTTVGCWAGPLRRGCKSSLRTRRNSDAGRPCAASRRKSLATGSRRIKSHRHAGRFG